MPLRILSLAMALTLGHSSCTSLTIPNPAPRVAAYFNHAVEPEPDVLDTANAPALNKRILRYVEAKGPTLAPTYQAAVCTQFLEAVLKPFVKLTVEEKRLLNVNIGAKTLDEARAEGDPALAGVYAALTKADKGIPIDRIEDAQPGDLVQFWYWNKGHCGIFRSYHPELGLISLYSSAGSTNGYGVQLYWMPKEMYIVRLRDTSPAAKPAKA